MNPCGITKVYFKVTGPWQGQGCERSSNPCGITRPVEVKVCGDRHACNSEAMNKYTSDLTLYFYITLLLFTQKQKAYEEIYTYADCCTYIRTAFAQKRSFENAQVFQGKTVNFSPVQKSLKSVTHRAGTTELVTLPAGTESETYYTASGTFYAGTSSGFQDATTEMTSVEVAVVNNDIYIQGLAYWFPDGWIKGTLNGTTAIFPNGQLIGEDEYGPEYIVGSEDAETVSDITFIFDSTKGTLTAATPLIIESGEADAISAYCYWNSPTFTKEEPAGPEVVELPACIELKEYSLSGTDYSGNPYSSSAFIGIDGNDVYLQGYSSYIPEALIKGTKEDDTVTFPGGQFLGSYAGYNSYFVEEAVFTYDETNDTYTASGDVYALLDNRYIDVWTTDPVLKGVVEKAATPANPAITALTNSQYGYYISFNVPNVDTNVEGLASSKLFYEIFTDIEHEVNPLTFTPTTHTYLTEDLTIIPFGFSEQYDFYDTQIYLNELYSADWNKIGIKSIYEGGGETHETEIQWYTIKPYAVDLAREALEAEIATAEALIDAEALPEGLANFQAAIDAAKALVDKEDATAAELNAAVAALKEAEAAYKAANGFGEAQWVARNQGYSNTQVIESFTIDENVAATLARNDGSTAPAYYNTGNALRLYAKNSLTLGGENVVLTKVEFTTGTGSNNGNNLSVDSGTKATSGVTTTWTPADNETSFVTFTQGGTSGHARIQTISVEYKIIPAEPAGAFDYEKITIDPAEGQVTQLYNFTLSFGGQDVTVNEDALLNLTNTDTDEVVAEAGIELNNDGTVSVGLSDKVTAAGKYTLNIPENAIFFNGKSLDPLAFQYTIAGEVEQPVPDEAIFDFEANEWNHALGSNNDQAAGNIGDQTFVKNDVTLSFTDGSTASRFWQTTSGTAQVRVYKEGTLTFKAPEGKAIVKVEFTANGSNFGLTASNGTLTDKVWEGNAAVVTFTATKTNQLTKAVVTLADANEGTITGIQNVNRTFNLGTVYTLSGQKVQTPAKGLYIVNGKKVVLK